MSKEQPQQIQGHLRAQMQDLARMIDDLLNGKARPKQVGIMLLMFDFSGPKPNRISYISNCDRTDALNSMKELITRWEGNLK